MRLCQYGAEETVREAQPFPVGATVVTPVADRRGLALTWEEAGRPHSTPIDGKKAIQTLEVRTAERTAKVLIYRDRFGRLFRGNPAAKTATLAGRTLVFLDRDFDGVFLEEETDAFGLLEARHVVPWRPTFVLGASRCELTSFDLPKAEATFSVTPLGTRLTDGARQLLADLNDERLFYGLVTTDLDEELSLSHCQKHADWMAARGAWAHEEPPDSPGYSAEGDLAGRSSIVDGADNPHILVDWFDTPFHGYDPSGPHFTRTALAERNGFRLMWVRQRNAGFTWPPTTSRLPAVFPPHEASDLPVSWWEEKPDPRAGDPSTDWGYPIRVYLAPDGRMCCDSRPRNVTVSLCADQARAEEPLQVVTCPADASPELAWMLDVMPFTVLPRRVLARDTLYVLTMDWECHGERFHWQSVFRTGAGRGQFRTPHQPK